MTFKLRGRGSREIAFRVRQEIANLSMFLWAPSPGAEKPLGSLGPLPDSKLVAASLKGTEYAREVERMADQIVAHRFPLLGFTIETGPEIDWRRDYVNGKTSPARFMRRVPYLNFEAVGDHKNIWELSRHQHLVLLAQAFLLTRNRNYLEELVRQLKSWMSANRFMRGINWTSALEVAFRACSWIWIWQMVSLDMDADFRDVFLAELFRHGCFLERNLSIYFSPNTHLLGEAVVLHALGALFPAFPGAEKWKSAGAAHALSEMTNQVRDDGSHFEQSTYYHVYAVDMFAFHLLLNPEAPKEYRERLGKMAEYLSGLLGLTREIPCFGDDDGGRFFHPYGMKTRYGRASLAVVSHLLRREFCFDEADVNEIAAWWLGPGGSASQAGPFDATRVYADGGMIVMTRGSIQIHFKYGPMGPRSAGHSHADLLSLVVRDGDEQLLIDAGTYTYSSDPLWRDWFRGTSAHNTVVIDGLNQATPVGQFKWIDKPESLLETEEPVSAVCRYHGFTHRRRLVWADSKTLLIIDEVSALGGLTGDHEVAQVWHSPTQISMMSPACFRIGARAKFWANPDTSREYGEGGQLGWMSPAFGVKEVAAFLRVVRRGPLPIKLVGVLDFEGRYAEWQPEWNDA